jgi:hypothetical protein
MMLAACMETEKKAKKERFAVLGPTKLRIFAEVVQKLMFLNNSIKEKTEPAIFIRAQIKQGCCKTPVLQQQLLKNARFVRL